MPAKVDKGAPVVLEEDVKVYPKVNKDIHKNAADGNLELMCEILKGGCDINCKDAFGCTALVWAIRNGKLDVGEIEPSD